MPARKLTQHALFFGIILLLGLTPLGFIPLPIAAITIVHLPVIIGAYYFGTKTGCILGAFFGLTSLISCFMQPDAIAAIVLGTGTGFGAYNLFLVVMVLFVPRVLVGLFSGLSFHALRRKNETVAMGVSAFIGSMTNTVFLLGALYVFAFEPAGLAFGLGAGFTATAFLVALIGIVATNGLVEAAAAVVICMAIGKVLLRGTNAKRDLK